MGDRGQICIKYDGDDSRRVYFYTHCNGSEIPAILKAALIRGKNRWNNDCYLARIIFSEMISESIMDTTGYGIDMAKHGDIEYPIPVVDAKTQTITWEEVAFGDEPPAPSTFEKFVS